MLIDAKPRQRRAPALPEQVTLVTRSLALLPLTLLLAGEVGFAQAPPTSQQTSAAVPAAPTTAAPAQSAAAEKKSDSVEPQGFTYNADGRRDPFVSLLRRGSTTNEAGKRVAGLAGLGTAEVSLRGTLRSQGSFVGILQGVRQQDLHRARWRQAGRRIDSIDHGRCDGHSAAGQRSAFDREGTRSAKAAPTDGRG